MEPLIAIGLAANILQFIHTAKQLVSPDREKVVGNLHGVAFAIDGT
jgi:hypothetical protein